MIKLPLLHKFKKPGPQLAAENTHYGIKLCVPETLSEHELVRQLVVIPPSVYKLPEDKGAAFDFGARLCSRELVLHLLQSLVWEKNLHVLAWLSSNPESVKLFRNAGLITSEPKIPEETVPAQENYLEPQTTTLIHVPEVNLVYSSMRSGQRIDADGDVLVWGHLNPGAEIKAGGSVIIAGRMLGVVHAGAFGRNDVFVWAGSFEARQVRIGTKLCYADKNSTACWKKCVLITLEDGGPVIREHKFFTVSAAVHKT